MPGEVVYDLPELLQRVQLQRRGVHVNLQHGSQYGGHRLGILSVIGTATTFIQRV